jgi:putative redox protein
MLAPKPPVTAELTWSEELVFNVATGRVTLVTDGKSTLGPSPVQLLAVGLAGCMAMDVVDIVRKGRHQVSAFSCQFSGDRAPDHPRRFVTIRLHFALKGAIPASAVERAIALSRDRYCSVWSSMRQDIDLGTTYTIEP